mgnify:CR=1 FL=1
MLLLKEKLELINNPKAFLEEILNRDKQIEELKQKLSRFPFELLKDEKLMSLIFTSVDQKIHWSVICKNTDKFCDVENKLYEIYSEYSESENYFTYNGNKVNRYKTIDFNKIKSGDVIVLNVFE